MNQLDTYLEKASSIAISGHIRPDGDCVGSTLAVYNYITENYPEKEVFLPLGEFLEVFDVLKSSGNVDHSYPDKAPFDLFISLDCAAKDRLDKAQKYFEAASYTLCIDHHVSNKGFADENEIQPDASSTCEVLYGLLDPAKVSRDTAMCLYTGIIHDSGVFQYSCTSSHTMEVAGKLMDYGFDFPKLIDDTFHVKTFEQNRIMGKALDDSRLYLDGRVILSTLSAQDLEDYHVQAKHLDGIVSQMRFTEGVLVSVFAYPSDEKTFKVSFRSNGPDVSVPACAFGGGGHVRAAGCSVEGTRDEVVAKILAELEKDL